jgi:hypothetical protein
MTDAVVTALIAQSSLGAAMRETADWPLDLPVSSTRPSTPLGPVCKWCWGEAERRATQPGMGAALAVYFTLLGEPQTPWCRAGEAP